MWPIKLHNVQDDSLDSSGDGMILGGDFNAKIHARVFLKPLNRSKRGKGVTIDLNFLVLQQVDQMK